MERSKFPFVDQVEFLHEEHEVLEGCVEMSFFAEGYNVREVSVVNVGVDSEEPLQDRLGYGVEVLRERNTCGKKRQLIAHTVCVSVYERKA